MAELPVYYESRVVGTIEVHAEGPSFTYAPAMAVDARRLSDLAADAAVAAPRAAAAVPAVGGEPAAGGDAAARPSACSSARRPRTSSAFSAELGRDTAGALSIGRARHGQHPDWRPIPNDKALERILAELPSKPFLVGEDGVSMSLAGVQTKLGVAIDDKGRICVPINGAPSTWILKPDSERLFGGVQNEALCLVLAKRLGLNAPEVTTGKAGKRTYLMVKRYDRVEQPAAGGACTRRISARRSASRRRRSTRSNQTGIPGPTLAEMFAVTRNAMQAPDVVNLLDYVIFNVLACNTDAHAKNYSLMISGKGFKLAPIYDVMCALAWEHVTRNMAQKIAGKSRGEHLKRRHWQRFAADVGLNAPRLIARVEALAKATLTETRNAAADVAAMPAGAHPLMQQVTEAIEGRARALLSGLTEDEPAGADKPAERRQGAASRSASRRARVRARARPEGYFAAA